MVATKENKCKERWCNNPTFKSSPYCSIHMKNESQIRMPMGNAKKVGIVIIIGIIGFFAIGFGGLALWEYYYPEEYAVWEAEVEAREALIETQKRLDKLAQQQKATQIKTSTALPSSCSGVNSIETYLYPTGQQCINAIDDRVNEYCLSETNGNKVQADACVDKVYSLIDRNCQDSDDQGFLSVSYEVCVMSELRFAYQNLIP